MRRNELSGKDSPRRTIPFVLCALALAICTFSCDSQLGGSAARTGKLKLSLKADTTSQKKEGSSSLTKALLDELAPFQTIDDYKIQILQDKDTIQTFDRYDAMPPEIELPEGSYTLVASKGENQPAAFENPFFEGSTSFTVKEGMSTPLDVTCTLANARITVDYTEEFKDIYADYTVLLKSPFTLENKLEISQKESRPAYMQVAPEGTDLAIAIRLKKKGEETEKTYPVPNSLKMERRQNIHLIFKPGEGTDGLGMEIWLDNELIEKTLHSSIPDYMWKPFALPKLFPENFPEDGQFEIAAGEIEGIDPVVGFVAPAGIGAFHILRWTESLVGDTVYYNLATQEGAKAAKEAGFEWNITNKDSLKDIREPGQLYIKNAIAPLLGSVEGEVYGFAFYAKDALPKANYTERLTFKVKVITAEAKKITN